MDCGKDFWGDDYSNHIKCITEDQKYGGSNYVSKENKGERKQEEWVMKIKEKVTNTKNMEPQLKELLESIILHSNIPRKEVKFRNFMRSSCRVSNTKLVDKVWEIFKDANAKNDNSNNSNGVKKDEGVTDADNKVNNEAVPQASSETGKADADAVKLNKRERKELRKEKQSKKSKKEKHSEHESKGKSGTKRKLDSIEEEEPNMESAEPKKKKKRKKGDDSLEQVVEIVEAKKKKKKKGVISQEEVPPQGTENKIENGTIATNGNHVLEEASPEEPQHPALFKWTNAIKRVLKEAPEEGLKLNKLQRKVFSLYYSAYGDAPNVKSKQELVALLSHKLNKKDKFIMEKCRVKLRT